MRIAVNAIFLQKDYLEGYGRFVKEIFSRIVRNHPEHEFIFLFDRPYDPAFVFGTNVTPLVIKPAARHPLLFKYWYDVKAPLALGRYKPDIWVQPYGFCSLTTAIPQLLVLHDLSFLHYPGFISWHQRWYYKAYTGKFLRKAARVTTVSEYSKQDIIKHYKVSPEKIGVVYSAAGEQFKPVSWQEKQQVKEQYTAGTEYFLCTGGIHPRKNLMNLLRAFSLFKKWQHSNMKLVVAGRLAWQYDEIVEKIKTYKYREDVILTGYLPDDELAKLTAAAYAAVYPSFFEGFGVPIVEALQCGVPVITSNTSSMPETGGEAALYADPGDPDAIAKHMLGLYRDETYRSRLIDAGLAEVTRFNWDTVAERMWENMMSVVDSQ
jgi:glycosyltransferase involved in cell wall biosynthesis